MYAKTKDLARTKEMLLNVLGKDSSRLDVLQEVAKIHYFMRDFEGAYTYYNKFEKLKDELKMDFYHSEKLKIATVMRNMGMKTEADTYLHEFEEYTEYDQSIYKSLNSAMIYAFLGDTQNAIEHIRLFSKEKNYHYWILLFLDTDPVMDDVKKQAEFKKLMRLINRNFWNRHKELRSSLSTKKLI